MNVYKTIDLSLSQFLHSVLYYLILVVRKPVFGVSDQVRQTDCPATETSYRLEILYIETRDIMLSR